MKIKARSLLAAMAPIVLIAACATERVHQDGLVDLDSGRYEAGLEKLELAAQKAPGNMTYRLDLETRREDVVRRLIADADHARASGSLDQAADLYQRLQKIEPGNARAERGLQGIQDDRRHAEMLARAQQSFANKAYDRSEAELRSILAEDSGYAAATALMEKIDLARGPVTVTPRLRTRDNRPVSLQFREANTKMVFEALSRQTGINFIFDKDVRSDGKTTIFVQDVSIDQAIDLVLGQNQLARQVLSDNMAVIYPNNAAKQKEYQDQIVKTFYLTNAAPKDAESMLKTVLNAKTLYIDEKTNLLVMRDTPEAVRMAEKLVASLDLPEPEVMMEVEVLEISRSRLQQLGINYPTSATVAMTSVSGGTGLTVADLHKQNSKSLTVTPISVSLNLMKQTGVSNVLASPRIRARNKEKAKILIGAREPVINNSVTPTGNGTPVITGNIQYLDVGLTLEVEPTIHLDSDVAIKVNLEVSSILKTIIDDKSGARAYEIGTRNFSTLLRLKDGETQILAGLIQDQDSHNAAEIPGLGDIPILGRLFGSHGTKADKTEIVMSITPRIMRAQPRPGSDVTEFWYGTESNTRSTPLASSSSADMSASRMIPAASQSSSPSGMNSSAGYGDTNTAPVPQPSLATTAAPVAVVTPVPPTNPVVARNSYSASVQQRSAAPITKAPTNVGTQVLSIDGPSEATVGDEFDVAVHMQSDQDLGRVRAQVRFDATALQLLSADPGEVATGADPKVETHAGGAQMELVGTANTPLKGSGSLIRLHFKALTARAATAIAAQVAMINTDGAVLAVSAPPSLSIVVMKASDVK